MEIPGTTPPNGPGYTHTETRTGPPLSYVAEKLRSCLEELHSLHSLANKDLPDNLPCPERHRGHWPSYNPKQDSVLGTCGSAFRFAVVAYLALNNLLAMANDHDLTARLLRMESADFTKWLDDIDREGSVT